METKMDVIYYKPPKIHIRSQEKCDKTYVTIKSSRKQKHAPFVVAPKPKEFFTVPDGFVDVKDEAFACVV